MADFFDQPVVCNTGPLLGLSRVNQIGLLGKLFPEVIIPMEVRDELLTAPHSDHATLTASLSSYTVLQTAASPEPLLLAELDRGEAAVIATAASRGLTGVIIDERKGRRVAGLVYHLQVKGTAALLLAAKQKGHLAKIRPVIEGMKDEGYFLSVRLIQECLRLAGEE
jgi:predicted nucleic acid-binding protein